MSDFTKELVKDVIIAGIIAAGVLTFIRPTIVRQHSMQPTLNNNDYIITYRRAYSSHSPKRGDIIVFKSDLVDENGKNKLLVKRVIGLPGDTISIHDGQVYIDGKMIEEDYTKDGTTNGDIEGAKVPDNKYFVMGDNRLVSVDSRYAEVGFVKKSDIKGKVVIRLFPFKNIKTF